MKKGILISLEGPEGAGKTSVLKGIVAELQQNYPVLTTREPGGVPIAEQIREVILDPLATKMDKKTELLLYMASRRQHLVEKVLPALETGTIVLMDRFIDSSIAYQGFARGLDLSAIDWLNQFATDQLTPSLTLYFDIDIKIGLKRIHTDQQREKNRLDMEAIEWHEQVRKGYLALLEKEPKRLVKIDASQPLDEVIATSLAVIKQRYGLHNK